MKSLNGRAKPVHDSKFVCSSNEGDNLFKMVRLIWCITRDDTILPRAFYARPKDNSAENPYLLISPASVTHR